MKPGIGGNMLPEGTQFKKGQSGNPGGRPVGARNRLTGQFVNALADDFEEHGRKAIRQCREEDPATYLKVIAALCPKELEIKRPLQEMEDDELRTAIRALQSFVDSRPVEGGSLEAPGGASSH